MYWLEVDERYISNEYSICSVRSNGLCVRVLYEAAGPAHTWQPAQLIPGIRFYMSMVARLYGSCENYLRWISLPVLKKKKTRQNRLKIRAVWFERNQLFKLWRFVHQGEVWRLFKKLWRLSNFCSYICGLTLRSSMLGVCDTPRR